MKPTVNFKNQIQKQTYSSNKNLQSYIYPLTENLKYLTNNNKYRSQSVQRNKENEDLCWLEKIVNQFQMYKDLKYVKEDKFKDSTFVHNNGIEISREQPLFLQNQQTNKIKHKNQRKQTMQQNKRNNIKGKQIKHQIFEKNLGYAKTNIFIKNNRSGSQNPGCNKKKQHLIFIQTPTQKNNTYKFQPKHFQHFTKKNLQPNKKTSSNRTQIFQSTNLHMTDLNKMKQKLSIQTKKHSNPNKNQKINTKVQNVKAYRKNLLLFKNCQQKLSVGKIVKNKSVQLKQKKIQHISTQNLKVIQKSYKNQVQNILSKQKAKKQQQKKETEQQNYIVKQFIQQNTSPINNQTIFSPKLITTQIPKVQKQTKINKDLNCQKQTNNSQQQKQQSQQNQNKKYNYLVLENRYDKILNKRQRKLNTSLGQRNNLLCNYNTVTDLFPKTTKNQSRQSLTNQNQLNCLTFDPKKFNNDKTSQTLAINNLIHQNIRYVQSPLTSQRIIQYSYVIQSQNPKQKIQPSSSQNKTQQWNIFQIFKNLDKNNTGILQQKNCAVQQISRQIRYILGPVLQQILYRECKYDFKSFVNRVEHILSNIQDSEIATYKNQKNMKKSKQLTIQTNTLQQNPSYPSFSNSKLLIQQTTLKQITSSIYLNKQSSTKKYAYQTNQFTNRRQNSFPIYNNLNKTLPKNCQSQKYIQYSKYQKNTIKDKQITKKQNKYIRFATFQDQQKQQQNQFINCCQQNNNRSLHIQQKFKQLNQFKSNYQPFNSSNKQKNQKNIQYSTKSIFIQQKSDQNKLLSHQKYKDQIVKLEILNQRLERYLNQQFIKDYQSYKLAIQDI